MSFHRHFGSRSFATIALAVLLALPLQPGWAREISVLDTLRELQEIFGKPTQREQWAALNEWFDGHAGDTLYGGGTSVDNAPIINFWINRIALEEAMEAAKGDEANEERLKLLRKVLDMLRGRQPQPPNPNGTVPPPPPEDPLPTWTDGDRACYAHCSPLWDKYRLLKFRFLDKVREIARLTATVSAAEDWLRICQGHLNRSRDAVDTLTQRAARLDAAHDVLAAQAHRDLDVAKQQVRADEYNLAQAQAAVDAARRERDAKLSAAEQERDRLRIAYQDMLQMFLRCLKACTIANEAMGRDCEHIKDEFLDQIRFYEDETVAREARELIKGH